jgi:hypothetical protein
MGFQIWKESIQEPHMKLRKRLAPEERMDALYGKCWRRAMQHKLLLGITRYCYSFSALEILNMLAEAKNGNRFHAMTLQNKLFLYFLCSIMWRGCGVSPLADPEYNALVRHLYSSKVLDQIETMHGNLPLLYRQTFLWDMPELARNFKKKGSMKLPAIPEPAESTKPTRILKRLPQHRK